MIACRFIFVMLISLPIFSSVGLAQRSWQPSPEMSRLAQALGRRLEQQRGHGSE